MDGIFLGFKIGLGFVFALAVSLVDLAQSCRLAPHFTVYDEDSVHVSTGKWRDAHRMAHTRWFY